VHQRQVFTPLRGALERVLDHPAHTVAGIDADLGGDFVQGAGPDHSAGTGVEPFSSLPDHHEVDVRVAHQRAGDARIQPRGPQVDVVIQREADLQQQSALEHAAGHRRIADGAQQDCVVAA
jgi:hypothetical protein